MPIESLGKRIKSYDPSFVVIVMKAIETEVMAAIKSRNAISQKIQTISFPACSEKNRLDCIQGIQTIFAMAVGDKIFIGVKYI